MFNCINHPKLFGSTKIDMILFLFYLSRKTLHVIVFKIGFSPPWFLQNIGKWFQVLDLGLIKVVLTDVKYS